MCALPDDIPWGEYSVGRIRSLYDVIINAILSMQTIDM